MSTGRKRKQLLKPRQDVHRSPVKRQSLDTKTEPLLASSYPLADYDCIDIKPDLTELQLQLAAAAAAATSPTKQRNSVGGGSGATTAATVTDEENKTDSELQQSDSDDDGYSEINFGARDVFCEDDVDEYDAEWTPTQTTPRLIFKFETPPQQTGLKSVRKFVCPLYYFNQLLGNRMEFFCQLAKSCNRRNGALGATPEELEIFVGLCLLMSDIKLPQLSDYWSDRSFFGFVGFAQKMTLLRFKELLQVLNFDSLQSGCTDSPHSAGGDAAKLIDYFNWRMSELYVCGQQLVLNEPIIQWKDKFSYQHELPPRQRFKALQLHLLSEQSGLIIRIMPELLLQQLPRNSRQLVAQRCELALQLLQQHQMRGHSIYVCKYYGSYGLAHELAKLGTYCSGLLDRNRYGNSKALVHQQLTPNSIATRYATPLMMAKWRRREKCVYFYSSDCLAIYAKEMSMQKINARPKLIQQLEFQLRPTQCSSRQQLISYQPNCCGMQRQQRLSIYLLNMLVFNAHLLYVANAQPTRGFPNNDTKLKTYAEFRLAIIKSLLKEDTQPAAVTPTAEVTPVTCPKPKSKTPAIPIRPVSDVKLLEPKHELIAIPQQTRSKPVRKNCQYCSKGGMLQFTKFMCNFCPNNPGLCQDPCFQLWHEQLKQLNMIATSKS